MFKIRNKKIRTVLALVLTAVMIFNSQSLMLYSAPEETEVKGVAIEVRADDGVQVAPKSIEIEELPILEIEESSVGESSLPLTDAEIDLLATITMAEAEGESEYGRRLVIDTILNRMDSDKFPNTVEGVVYQKNQFEPTRNGRMERCYVKDDIRQLVVEELTNRTNYEVMFFRGGKFSSYGTPLFQEGNHYFSKL